MEQSNVAVFTNESAALVAYSDKKGILHNVTGEAAVFKGGEAIKALREIALITAGNKAMNGRFRAAAEILGVAFPRTLKAYREFMGCEPYENASRFAVFVERCEVAAPGKNGFTRNQLSARTLIAAMRKDVPALKVEGAIVQ